MTAPARPRVVFDTNVVVSALVFTAGSLAWLRRHWRAGGSVPLASRASVEELKRILAYSKFHLSSDGLLELLADYLPYCEVLDPAEGCSIRCRDIKDQPFLDLAHCGKAEILISGDDDLLVLAGQTEFVIETPEAYRRRISGGKQNP